MLTRVVDRDAARRATADRRARLHAAARRVVLLHPGPVGRLCARELHYYAASGLPFGTDAVLLELADEVLSDGNP